MKIIMTSLLICCTAAVFAQDRIEIIDFVKIKDNKRRETLYFYENNWKMFRDIALEKGYIKSYRLLSTPADAAAAFDLMLITEYADSTQLRLSEDRFQQIIKSTRPNGMKLLNELKPSDFRQNLFLRKADVVFSSGSPY